LRYSTSPSPFEKFGGACAATQDKGQCPDPNTKQASELRPHFSVSEERWSER
jgi:hypothetical protein